MGTPAIEARGLRKSYGELEAVKGIDLTVAEGEVYAFLGPNGAGKTTTVEILEGHRMRSGGDVRVLGSDPGRSERSLKERIGIVLQETAVDPYLSVAEVIELYRGYYPRPLPLDHIVELVGLQDKKDVRVNRLSGGQQRRLDVAIGLAGDPDVLFLDEPTTGFDPSARRNAWAMIKDLAALGKTIFLTTHYMDEAQTLADRVGIIVQGILVAEGSPTELIQQRSSRTTINCRIPVEVELPPRFSAVRQGSRIAIETEEPTRLLHELTGWAIENDVDIEDLNVSTPTLEDIYLSLTAGVAA